MTEVVCPGCSKAFTPTPPSRLYCRPSCRVRHLSREPLLPGLCLMDPTTSELPDAPPNAQLRKATNE